MVQLFFVCNSRLREEGDSLSEVQRNVMSADVNLKISLPSPLDSYYFMLFRMGMHVLCQFLFDRQDSKFRNHAHCRNYSSFYACVMAKENLSQIVVRVHDKEL